MFRQMSDMGGGLAATLAASALLDPDLQVSMNPVELSKAGAIITKMEKACHKL